jgi:hypothetical protein
MNESGQNSEKTVKPGLKVESPAVFGRALMEGQLKERSEGVQTQRQAALGVVVAAGSRLTSSS